MLHADSQHVLQASFPDGTTLQIFTATTGASQIDSTGVMGIGPGAGSQDVVNRFVVDRGDQILFAYNVEASRGASPGTVRIRIDPISGASEESILKDGRRPGRPTFAGAHLPTVSGVREFPSVKMGELVTLDVLYNPTTGEKIYDVLRPITGSSSVMSVTTVPVPQEISLKQIALRVNGRMVAAPAAWMIGAAVRIDIPGRGTYVVAANDPREAFPQFAAAARADGKTLSWSIDGATVEITSATNVLTRGGKGSLWVYHDPHYQPDVVGLQSADSVGWLLPKK
jgi:hypothetical protein